MNDQAILIIIIASIIMSAFFSASETAFSSLNRIRVKSMAEKGNKRAALVLRLAENYDSLLSTILIGNNIVNIASASLATVLFVKLMGEELGPGLSTAVTTVAVLIFGEVTPKSIAKESPESFAMFSAPFLKALMTLLTPFNYAFTQWKKLLSRVIRPSGQSGITGEELLSIVEEAREEGGIDEQEDMLIHSALEFTERDASDVLTPRMDITAVSTDDSEEEVARLFEDTAYSRLPVFEGTIDHIVGIIYQKDFYSRVYRREGKMDDIIRPALFVPQNKRIGALLRELQSAKIHMAVVLDEYGGTVGIVTLEDILEELVGEIWDEYDEVSHEIEKISENEYLISGGADTEKVFEALDINAEDDAPSVLNGWIMGRLGRVPREGDSFEYEGWKVTVKEMTEKRVDKARFTSLKV